MCECVGRGGGGEGEKEARATKLRAEKGEVRRRYQ